MCDNTISFKEITQIATFLLCHLLTLHCHSQTETIAIQPFGPFEETYIDTLQQTIQQVYGYKTMVLSGKPMPQSAFIHVKSPRYRADSLLKILRRELPVSAHYILGLTERDISTTKRDASGAIKKPAVKYTDWGVFGLGYRPGPAAVVSTHRLQTPDKDKFIARFLKICIHEIGHNLGLQHCRSSDKCIMRDAAETIKTIDQVPLKLCDRCRLRVF